MEKTDRQLSEREQEEQRNINAFKEEAKERLAELEEAMLELENAPGDPKLIDSAFRAMHTIKGSGAMFGFDEIVAFTHQIETIYDYVRDGKINVTPELIALTLSAHDQIQKMLQEPESNTAANAEQREEITKAFKALMPNNPESSQPIQVSLPASNTTPDDHRETISYRIRFKPALELFANGTNPILLLNELRDLGECQVIARVDQIPLLGDIDPEQCYTGWDIILTTRQSKDAIDDVFIFIDEASQVTVNVIGEDIDFDSDEADKKIGEILVERGDIRREDLERVLQSKEPLGRILTSSGVADISQVQSALAEQNVIKRLKEDRKKTELSASIRVASQKLDKLVDLVGELVTGQARLTQIANTSNEPSLLSIAEEIERLTTELRDNTMSVRMLNFGTTFNKFKRLVRDLSVDLGTEMILVTAGGETELDKTVIEQLNDPLVHIIRNSADHGIEPPGVRAAAGKPKQGTIRLSAAYAGAHVLIRIQDDGAGLNADVIRKKAVERGLINADTRLSDRETFTLIFEPGFSTAAKVTNVSGRGVGMDVVKKAIEALRGTVEIESVLGAGTTITLKLPLTLAIIDGLLIRVGEEFFVIPLAAVEECIELTRADIDQSHGRHITNVRGQIVPYIRLRDQFDIGGQSPEIEQVVITEVENQRVGFVVDHVIGQHQTVIKNLSRVYRKAEAISGATIMADGTVALILDINKHLQMVQREYHEQFN
jgi:two-component system, chemotaxis family, sensor kinase CheA